MSDRVACRDLAGDMHFGAALDPQSRGIHLTSTEAMLEMQPRVRTQYLLQ
jgi:hypothetical protein